MTEMTNMRAIDLYSGVGGWSLGLRMAGIEVIASYEISGAANETNFKNNHHLAQTVDIRRLELSDLPEDIDVVVGSPPCTQFSFANRGGNGDIDDGLKDIVKFLNIVEHVKPKAWAMENVPRVAKILAAELKEGGRLAKFLHLDVRFTIVNMEEYGLPQKRHRCIAGNFDFELLRSYRGTAQKLTLGDVVDALSAKSVVDPIYGSSLPADLLWDHDKEVRLNEEEARINRANKVTHPVYNSMHFPDRMDRSVRTITATCTRVSRESVVILDAGANQGFRRLTLRERATLQGFPINFQFFGGSFGQKLKMIGNAVPPLFSYYVANAINGVSDADLINPKVAIEKFSPPKVMSKKTLPEKSGVKYPEGRKFRFAIPSLRLKSGVRFDLANTFSDRSIGWHLEFVFGNSKFIHSLTLDKRLFDDVFLEIGEFNDHELLSNIKEFQSYIGEIDFAHLQSLWSHRGPGMT